MLKLKLTNIKNLNTFECTTKDYMIHVKGNSGSGKSTLLEALYFSLTDKNGGQFTQKKSRPQIEISMNDYKIVKVKNPEECFLFKEGQLKCLSTVAISTIKSLFGCEIIRFGTCGTFLSLSSTEKRNYLEKEVLGLDDLSWLDSRMDEELKKVDYNLNKSTHELNLLNKQLSSKTQWNLPVDIDDDSILVFINQLNYSSLFEKINHLKTEIKSCTDKILSDKEVDTIAIEISTLKSRIQASECAVLLASLPSLESLQNKMSITRKRKRFEELNKKQNHPPLKCPKCDYNLVANSTFSIENRMCQGVKTLSEQFEYDSLSQLNLPQISDNTLRSTINVIETTQNKLMSVYNFYSTTEKKYFSDSKIKNIIKSLNDTLAVDGKNRALLNFLQQELTKHTQALNKLGYTDGEINLKYTRDQLEDYRAKITANKEYQKLLNESEQTKLKHGEYSLCKETCSELKKEWLKWRVKSTNEIQDLLLTWVNEFLEYLFPHDTPVAEFKSDSLNLQITFTYGDRIYTSLNDFSSGEKSRIIICFVCALCILKNQKFILLDETLSTLDEDNFSRCIDFLKKISQENKIWIFIVSHSTNMNFIDENINMNF